MSLLSRNSVTSPVQKSIYLKNMRKATIHSSERDVDVLNRIEPRPEVHRCHQKDCGQSRRTLREKRRGKWYYERREGLPIKKHVWQGGLKAFEREIDSGWQWIERLLSNVQELDGMKTVTILLEGPLERKEISDEEGCRREPGHAFLLKVTYDFLYVVDRAIVWWNNRGFTMLKDSDGHPLLWLCRVTKSFSTARTFVDWSDLHHHPSPRSRELVS